MIYEPLKRTLLSWLKAPIEPPEPPAGSYESVQVFRASPGYLRYRLVGVWILAGFLGLMGLMIAVGAIAEQELAGLFVLLPYGGIAILAVVTQYVAVRIDYDMRYYIVTDRSIRIRQGAFVIREKTMTHANVQNLNVVQGPLMRFFGIKSLAVDTAGGGSGAGQSGQTSSQHRFELAGIENASEVRDLVLGHLRQRGGGSGLGDLDDVERAPALDVEALSLLGEVRDAAARLRVAAERME